MPSRKYSVNSHTSLSSQKTSGSSIVENFCHHRAASVHQINELYAALSELIHSSPVDRYGNTRDSSAKRKSRWSSEDNLLGNETQLAPISNSEGQHMRPARSASCLSSKSCYAAIPSNVPANVSSRNVMTSKTSGICSKIVAKFRGKALRERSKSTGLQHVKGMGQEISFDGVKVHTIDDLLEMAQLEINANGKTNSKDKKGKVKVVGRKKAYSFDSCETETTNISVHKVSTKLKTWYTRAASYAATIEDEERSRAESSVTGSTENFLESSANESRGDRINEEERANEELIVRDFDASSNDALNESKLEDLEHQAEKRTPTCGDKISKRRAYSELNSKGSSVTLKRSFSKSESKDDSFEKDDVTANTVLSQTLWKSEKRCDFIRRLSLNIVEDVLAEKSATCTQIGTAHLHRDLSKHKVQQWLKNLHSDDEEIGCLNCKEGDAVSSNNADDGRAARNNSMQHSHIQTTLDVSVNRKGSDNSSRGHGLSSQALFYIPNIERAEQSASVNMILNF